MIVDTINVADECRTEFEKWFDAPTSLERNGANYRFMTTHTAWSAWQAGWGAQEANIALYRDTLREALPMIEGAVEEDERLKWYLPPFENLSVRIKTMLGEN